MKQEYFFSEAIPTMYYPNFINSNNSSKVIAHLLSLYYLEKLDLAFEKLPYILSVGKFVESQKLYLWF